MEDYYVPQDLLNMREQCQGYFNNFSSYGQGATVTFDAPDDSDYLHPNILVIAAPKERPGTAERKRTLELYDEMVKSFYKHAFGEDHGKVNWVRKEVNSYEEMKKRTEDFCRKLRKSQLPMLIFMGHGSQEGELCFYDEGTWESSKKALKDVHDIFIQHKPDDMADHQFRIVFTQCFGHLVDAGPTVDTKETRGKVQFDKRNPTLEYIYFTCETKKKTGMNHDFNHKLWAKSSGTR